MKLNVEIYLELLEILVTYSLYLILFMAVRAWWVLWRDFTSDYVFTWNYEWICVTLCIIICNCYVIIEWSGGCGVRNFATLANVLLSSFISCWVWDLSSKYSLKIILEIFDDMNIHLMKKGDKRFARAQNFCIDVFIIFHALWILYFLIPFLVPEVYLKPLLVFLLMLLRGFTSSWWVK